MKKSKTIIIAHRGVKSLATVENTLESFQIAIDMNLQYIEFDVRKTLDDQLIVYHNEHLWGKKICNYTYDELCQITTRSNYTIPLLTDVLHLCRGKLKLDIELKEKGYEKDTIELITSIYPCSDFFITSFHDSVIHAIKEIDPSVRCGLLLGADRATLKRRFSEIFPYKRLKSSGADFIVSHYWLVTKFLVYSCRKRGIDIYVWTVNKDKIYKRLIRKKVAAIITDYPQKYLD